MKTFVDSNWKSRSFYIKVPCNQNLKNFSQFSRSFLSPLSFLPLSFWWKVFNYFLSIRWCKSLSKDLNCKWEAEQKSFNSRFECHRFNCANSSSLASLLCYAIYFLLGDFFQIDCGLFKFPRRTMKSRGFEVVGLGLMIICVASQFSFRLFVIKLNFRHLTTALYMNNCFMNYIYDET